MQECFTCSCYHSIPNDPPSLKKEFLWQEFVPSMREVIFLNSLLDLHWKPLILLGNNVSKFKSPAPVTFKLLWKVSKGSRERDDDFSFRAHFLQERQGRAYWSVESGHRPASSSK